MNKLVSMYLTKIIKILFKVKKNNNSILLLAKCGNFGGTKTSLENLLNFYKKTDYNISTIFFKEDKNVDIPLFLINNKYSLKIINKKKLFIYSFTFINSILNLFLNFWKIGSIVIRKRPSLLVVSDWSPSYFLLLMLLPVKTINIVHSYPTKKQKFVKYFLNNKVTFLTVSNYSRKQILLNWTDYKLEERVEVVYNCVSYEDNLKKRTTVVPFRILTLGHVVLYKNPYIWLEVANKVIRENPEKKIEFIWAGDGELLNEFKKIISTNNFKNINFIGYQSNIKKLYSESYIYFQPSILESFGLSVAQAMSFGIPCVVSNNGGLPELIIDEINGFVVDNDIDTYVKKISLLLNNQELNKKMGIASIKIFENKFTQEIFYDKMRLIHKKILNND